MKIRRTNFDFNFGYIGIKPDYFKMLTENLPTDFKRLKLNVANIFAKCHLMSF